LQCIFFKKKQKPNPNRDYLPHASSWPKWRKECTYLGVECGAARWRAMRWGWKLGEAKQMKGRRDEGRNEGRNEVRNEGRKERSKEWRKKEKKGVCTKLETPGITLSFHEFYSKWFSD
jgi:hypothetical protein